MRPELHNAYTPIYPINLLEAYFSERSIEVSNPAGTNQFVRTNSCGVPQGSVLGPDLWNFLYHRILKIDMPPDVELSAFSDDIAVLGTSQIPFVLEERLEEAYNRINRWIVAHGLELAAEKTGCVVYTNKRVRNEITVRCGGYDISSTPSLKYLSVQLYKKLHFVEHADLVSNRAAAAAKQLRF